MLWEFVLRRFNALVYLSENFALQKSNYYKASHMTAIAFISCLISSVFHRPFSKSWWLPFQKMIDAVSCKRSSLLYLCDLFELSSDGQYWTCKKSMAPHLGSVYSKQLAKHINDYLHSPNTQSGPLEISPVSTSNGSGMPSLPVSMYMYKLPPMPSPILPQFSFNFEAQNIFPSLNATSALSYYMDLCQTYFYGYGLTQNCAEAFANLLMKELVDKFTNWGKYLLEPENIDILLLNGQNFFRKKEHLGLLLKVYTYGHTSYFLYINASFYRTKVIICPTRFPYATIE